MSLIIRGIVKALQEAKIDAHIKGRMGYEAEDCTEDLASSWVSLDYIAVYPLGHTASPDTTFLAVIEHKRTVGLFRSPDELTFHSYAEAWLTNDSDIVPKSSIYHAADPELITSIRTALLIMQSKVGVRPDPNAAHFEKVAKALGRSYRSRNARSWSALPWPR